MSIDGVVWITLKHECDQWYSQSFKLKTIILRLKIFTLQILFSLNAIIFYYERYLLILL